MGQVIYFAYGSNLSTRQMRARCATARVEARAVLRNHALAFGGFSARWGGPAATLVPARGAEVEGLLYRLQPADLRALDGHEGHPFVYERVQMLVTDEHGRRRRAEVYFKPGGHGGRIAPPAAYASLIRRAYRRLGFDATRLTAAIKGRGVAR